MARARIGSEVKTGLKFFVYGKHGARKSNTVADFAKMVTEDGRPLRVLYIDCETGSIDGFGLKRLRAEGVDTRNIFIVYTSSLSEVREYSDRFINNDLYYEIDSEGYETENVILDADGNPFVADAIVIDGITVIADNVSDAAINLSEKRAAIKAKLNNKTTEETEVMVGTAGLEFKDHNKIKSSGKSLIRNLITNTDKYVAITGRAKDKKEMQKNSRGEMVLTYMGYEVPESWDFIQYEAYTVIHNMINEDGEVYGVVEQKDRTGKFKPNEIIENPSVALWQDVINENKSKSENVGMSQKSFNEAAKLNEDEYKKISGYSDNEKIKESKTTSASELIVKIEKAKATLPPAKRKAMKPLLEKEGLPTKFTEDLSFEVLTKVYEILTKN